MHRPRQQGNCPKINNLQEVCSQQGGGSFLAGAQSCISTLLAQSDHSLLKRRILRGVLLPHLHTALQVRRGVLAEESGALMKEFFQARRLENDRRALDADSTRPEDDRLAKD